MTAKTRIIALSAAVIVLVLFVAVSAIPPSPEDLCREAVRARFEDTYVFMTGGIYSQDASSTRVIGNADFTDVLGGKHRFRYDCFLSRKGNKWAVDSLWGV